MGQDKPTGKKKHTQTAPGGDVPSGMIFIPRLTENGLPAGPPLTAEETAHATEVATSVLKYFDTDGDRKISATEAAALVNPHDAARDLLQPIRKDLLDYNATVRAENLSTQVQNSLVIDDAVLFDQGVLTEKLLAQPALAGLSPEALAHIVRATLPGGIATIRLSDEAGDYRGQLDLVKLPNHKLLVALPTPAI